MNGKIAKSNFHISIMSSQNDLRQSAEFAKIGQNKVRGDRADTIAHKFTKGEKYRIVAAVEYKLLVNDELVSQVDFLNKIAVHVLDTVRGSGKISAVYQISARAQSHEGVYQLKNETQSSFSPLW